MAEFVFAPDDEQAWVAAEVIRRDGDSIELKYEGESATRKLSGKEAEGLEGCGVNLATDMDNLCDLDVFSQGSILHHVRKRFREDKIYTLVGNILIAVNPFRGFKEGPSRVSDDLMAWYKTNITAPEHPPPHNFFIAADAYESMMQFGASQSVLIAGESGAGKTEATKIVLKCVMRAEGARGE